MNQLFVFLGIAALGNVVYHVAQKAMPVGSNPMIVLMGVYAVAFVLAAVASPFFATPTPAPWTSQVLNWPIVLLGAGVLAIEIGFLLAYRTGSPILQWSGVAVNAAAAAMLLPIATLAFRQSFSPVRAIGIVLALTGMALMSR
jgi:multidrug transporter EmrE-like cation transporter